MSFRHLWGHLTPGIRMRIVIPKTIVCDKSPNLSALSPHFLLRRERSLAVRCLLQFADDFHDHGMKINTNTIERGRGKNKHYWTIDEDAALLDSLHELYQNTLWRAECGFKNGYLAQLETMLVRKLPGSELKASPHIESRIKTLKAKYYALSEMLCHKGFDWNDKQMMLICERKVYIDWVKTHKEANGLYGKQFLHYHILNEIYGKERANGAIFPSYNDDKEELRGENVEHEDDLAIEVDLHSNPGVDVNVETQVYGSDSSEDYEVSFTQQPSGRRRKSPENSPSISNCDRNVRIRVMEEMGKNFGKMSASIATMKQKIEGLTKVWSNNREVADMQSKLDKELTQIEGLTELQVFRATNILATKHDLLRVFFSMSKERKRAYVFNLLEYGL
ncbi:Myb/SANT-like domain containing protein [Parasponia andersonii]|uniref:Myb/SANT-like domain containing protein n=1 Tax=Parasponia andersonii TaxID=3476 RepID=A0A2P5A9M4_PARAD|nr:Myb/SANT-like domain containing protein [Parasponia andersonii]